MFAMSSSCVMFCGKICKLWNSPVSARDACAFCCCTAAHAARNSERVIATMMGRETFDIRMLLRPAILQKPCANGKESYGKRLSMLLRVFAASREPISREAAKSAKKNQPLPPDPIVLPVIARSAPERTVRAIDQDGVDRAGGALLERHRVAHPAQFAAPTAARRS